MINLRDKSLGTPFINLTYFPFACGEEILLKFVKSLIFFDQDCSSIRIGFTQFMYVKRAGWKVLEIYN